MSSIKTTGELRDFLSSVMHEVRDDKLAYDKANVIVKTASQINESIYAELKAKELAKQLGYKGEALGALKLGE